ncbi:collagen alpha-1(X) chain-like [Watersipora subatra]|uniref:collagen alpha-1(X) chain-like n=1 Tax=Watersipora subatra TaxID=2589382 RepID=UPI00355C8EAB
MGMKVKPGSHIKCETSVPCGAVGGAVGSAVGSAVGGAVGSAVDSAVGGAASGACGIYGNQALLTGAHMGTPGAKAEPGLPGYNGFSDEKEKLGVGYAGAKGNAGSPGPAGAPCLKGNIGYGQPGKC